jgi:hypothetical protein
MAVLLAVNGPFTGSAVGAPLQAAITGTNAIHSGTAVRTGAEVFGTPQPSAMPPISDIEMQGYGCLVSGAIATGLTALAGSNELILVVAGGTLSPTNPIGAAVAFAGTVFASVCAVGALATPALVRIYRIYEGY